MNIEIANKLLQLRKEKGLSQEQLAQKLGISRQAISKWERAEASPDTDNLIELAKLYDISLDELLLHEPSSKEKNCRQLKKQKIIILMLVLMVFMLKIIKVMKSMFRGMVFMLMKMVDMLLMLVKKGFS